MKFEGVKKYFSFKKKKMFVGYKCFFFCSNFFSFLFYLLKTRKFCKMIFLFIVPISIEYLMDTTLLFVFIGQLFNQTFFFQLLV